MTDGSSSALGVEVCPGHSGVMANWCWHAAQRGWVQVLLVLAALCVWWWAYRHWRRYLRRRIARKALGAERTALDVLRRHGYCVLDTQVHQVWTVLHGERRLDVSLRADALVQRGERRFIVEVKSSALVAQLRHGPTRRQLLEYAVAYQTDGVLLVDMTTEHVEEVTFPGVVRTRGVASWCLGAACVLAFAIGAWVGSLS